VHTCPTCGDQLAEDVAFCPRDGARLGVVRGEADLVGTIVADRYRITSRIGGGGMGQVFKAEHVRMKRTCAIKVLRPNLSGDPEATQRFQREAENASQLSHPNVAQIYDFGEHDGLVYLAMEYIAGESLAALLQREPAVHPDIAADIIAQSAAALEAAHARGVLHRDVKPDNIMLGRNADGTYQVKLVDFGIARAMTSEEQRVTRTGLVIGTPEFMSPEQIAGEELDARSDLYALALVAFQCVTGKEAFPSTSSKQNLILRLTSRPRTLTEVRDDVPWPESLQQVFDRALAPDPGGRYDSVGQFAEELWAAIGAMAPSETAELYRKALEQRVVNVVSRTPHGDMAAISGPRATPSVQALASAATLPARPAVTAPSTSATVAAPTVGAPAATAPPATTVAAATATPMAPTPVAPRVVVPGPQWRRRPRLFPWLLVFALGGWAWIVSTGRTAEAKATFEAVVANVKGLIGVARKAGEPAPRADVPAPRPEPRATAPVDVSPDVPVLEQAPAAAELPRVSVPDPAATPLVADSVLRRPPAPRDTP
jgi:serine/threonine-protein kinase